MPSTTRVFARARTAIVLLAILCLGATLLLTEKASQAATPPSFTTFVAPAPLGRGAAEPSIGVNWSNGTVMYLAGLETLRVTNLNDATGAATWTDVSPLSSVAGTLDPILFLDFRTNRTFVSQLQADCSVLSFTDDDGAHWVENPIGCGLAATPDHQTVGGGPFAPGLMGVGYSDTVYYCAQGIVVAECSLSVNGGVSFNPAVPIYTALQCGGLHGHLRAGPDGAVYVPNGNCGGKQGFSVSTNNGSTWTVRTVPGTSAEDESDPSVAVGRGDKVAGGRTFFCFQDGDGHAKVTSTNDKGVSWSAVKDIGASFGIQNSQFPAVIVGDDDRAACAFLGTTTAGDDQKSTFTGVWHLYVSVTYDGGATWTTIDTTPNDPVQRGAICLAGFSCSGNRNLLDFNDIAIDKQGRVYAAYADGCVGTCVSGSGKSDSEVATFAKQSGGTTLFAAYDQTGPTVPGQPTLSATAGNAQVQLSWTTPNDGGSAISNYRIYRGTSSGGETLLATVGNVNSYTDTSVVNGLTYYYQVSAVNGIGEGSRSNEVSATPQAPSAPSAPRNLVAKSAHGKRNPGTVLTWQAPASSGTSAITSYRIYRGTSSGGETFLATVGNVLTYSDTATTKGVTYYYKVTAVNSVGEGPPSNESSAVAN
jgi:hypothetical protein